MVLLLSCIEPAELPVDSGRVESAEPDSVYETGWPQDSDSAVDTDTDPPDPRDRDEDGYDETQDCDDEDAEVHPGAEEAFDGIDNDCDGRIDANGEFRGQLTVVAEGWYEGTKYTITPDCPVELTRELTEAPFTVTCTVPSTDTYGVLLLGETLTITPDDPYLWELDRWSGTAVYTSSSGWDTNGTGSMSWKSMDEATLTIGLDTQWLDLTGSGGLAVID